MSGFTRIVCETSGRTFCVVWLLALLAFPLVKGMPAGYLAVALGGAGGIVLLRWRATERLLDAAAVLSTRRFLVLLLLVAVGLRVVAVFYFPLEPQVDDEQFHRYATSMLRGEGYGAPGVRAWFPPGMSLLLTAWYAVTGPSALAGKFLQVVVSCALVWQTWAAARTSCDERTARLAAILVAVFPTLVFYTATLGYELVLALILLVVCRLAGAAATSATRNVLYAAAVGALLGVGALVKPICILMPVLLALAWWTAGVSWSRVLTRVATVTVVMVLIIAPWTIRNYRVLGAFVPVSTNGGQTLYSANNPNATGLAMRVDPVPGEVDEVSRDRLRMRAALRWMAGHPGRWLQLALIKATYTWGTSSSIMSVVSTDRLPPRAEAICKAILNVAWAALWVWCAVASVRRSVWSLPVLVPMTFVLGYVFAIHLFYEAHSRHQIPVIPFLLIVAAVGLTGRRMTNE